MLHCLLFTAVLAQGAVPTFQYNSYTLAGSDPAKSGSTTIPTVLVPVTLSFEAKKSVMDAGPDVARVLRSPVFATFAFPSGGTTQYADAMLRTTFPKAEGWHTLLGKPEVKPVKITVPLGYGYVLTSKKSGSSFAVADVEFLQRELFKQVSKQDGKLVIAMTHNTAYYALGDATVCCSWGTHGVDSATGNSFVLGSYLHNAPGVVEDGDVQPLTQQLAEFVNDPLHEGVSGGRIHPVGAPGAAHRGIAQRVVCRVVRHGDDQLSVLFGNLLEELLLHELEIRHGERPAALLRCQNIAVTQRDHDPDRLHLRLAEQRVPAFRFGEIVRSMASAY